MGQCQSQHPSVVEVLVGGGDVHNKNSTLQHSSYSNKKRSSSNKLTILTTKGGAQSNLPVVSPSEQTQPLTPHDEQLQDEEQLMNDDNVSTCSSLYYDDDEEEEPIPTQKLTISTRQALQEIQPIAQYHQQLVYFGGRPTTSFEGEDDDDDGAPSDEEADTVPPPPPASLSTLSSSASHVSSSSSISSSASTISEQSIVPNKNKKLPQRPPSTRTTRKCYQTLLGKQESSDPQDTAAPPLIAPPRVTSSSSSSTAVNPQALAAFGTLQAQLNSKTKSKKDLKAQKQRKYQDRLKDVQGYRQLWKDFESIQQQVENKEENKENIAPVPSVLEQKKPPSSVHPLASHSMGLSAPAANPVVVVDSSLYDDLNSEENNNMNVMNQHLLTQQQLEIQRQLFAGNKKKTVPTSKVVSPEQQQEQQIQDYGPSTTQSMNSSGLPTPRVNNVIKKSNDYGVVVEPPRPRRRTDAAPLLQKTHNIETKDLPKNKKKTVASSSASVSSTTSSLIQQRQAQIWGTSSVTTKKNNAKDIAKRTSAVEARVHALEQRHQQQQAAHDKQLFSQKIQQWERVTKNNKSSSAPAVVEPKQEATVPVDLPVPVKEEDQEPAVQVTEQQEAPSSPKPSSSNPIEAIGSFLGGLAGMFSPKQDKKEEERQQPSFEIYHDPPSSNQKEEQAHVEKSNVLEPSSIKERLSFGQPPSASVYNSTVEELTAEQFLLLASAEKYQVMEELEANKENIPPQELSKQNKKRQPIMIHKQPPMQKFHPVISQLSPEQFLLLASAEKYEEGSMERPIAVHDEQDEDDDVAPKRLVFGEASSSPLSRSNPEQEQVDEDGELLFYGDLSDLLRHNHDGSLVANQVEQQVQTLLTKFRTSTSSQDDDES